MSIEPDHKAMALSKTAAAEAHVAGDAEAIVAALEKAAATASAHPPSRKAVEVARRLFGELRTVCEGRAEAKALVFRGRAALRMLQAAQRQETDKSKLRREEEGAPAAPSIGPDERRAARIEAAQRRTAARSGEIERNVDRMRRIIGALEDAATTEDPARFTQQARLAEQIWDDIGPAGPEASALLRAYRKASAAFWAKVPEAGGPVGSEG